MQQWDDVATLLIRTTLQTTDFWCGKTRARALAFLHD